MTQTRALPGSRGFVFGVTGAVYTDLARRAARSLAAVHPEAEIDLFTDQEIDDPVFARIHRLSSSWFRPKMEALAASRFERTICLDADIMVIGDLTPVFDLLDRFDIAAAHNRILNGEPALRLHTKPLPAAFANLNSGVIGLKASPGTQRFLTDWQEGVKASGADRDQPAFRELLYDSDLRLYVLPPGYNLLTFLELETWSGIYAAPRVLHSPNLHKRGAGDPETPFTLEEVVGDRHAGQLRTLLAADRLLSPDTAEADRVLSAPAERRLPRRLKARARALLRMFGGR